MAPASVLRPYSSSTDAAYLPVLLRESQLSKIRVSNTAFLIHPGTVAVLFGTGGVALYYLNALFFTVLALPEEATTFQEKPWAWQDNIALVIYALPPLAAIVAAFFGIANWFHTRLWTKIAERQERRVDLLDVEGYYSKESESAFWCLEYQNQIVVSLGVDARNPGRQIKALPASSIPSAQTTEQSSSVEASAQASGENAQDLELFRDSYGSTPSEPSVHLPNHILDNAASDSLLSSHASSSFSSTCQLRHLTISPTFRETPQVDSFILDLAVHAALGTSSSTPTRHEQVMLVLDPKMEKSLRGAALNRGFRIVGSVPLDRWSGGDEEVKSLGLADRIEAVLRRVWPIRFEQEMLLLRREDWERQKMSIR